MNRHRPAPRRASLFRLVVAATVLVLIAGRPARGIDAQAPSPERIAAGESAYDAGTSSASALATLRAAATLVDERAASGALRRTAIATDTLVAGRMQERLAQYFKGVPVFGSDATRQLNGFGQTLSVFSVFYPDVAIDVTPVVTAAEARALSAVANGAGAVVAGDLQLVVLPMSGGYRLAWEATVNDLQDGGAYLTFIDAVTGATLLRYANTWTQAAVGTGVGIADDRLALNTARVSGGAYQAIDLVRPGGVTTYDLAADADRAARIAAGLTGPDAADIATSRTNAWTGEVASAHAYAGLALDYFRTRFGRAGLDNHDLPLRIFVDVGRPEDATAPPGSARLRLFHDAAFYGGRGDVFFGAGSLAADGRPRNRAFAAGLDVVAHELTHGVTRYSSNLIYQFESGALNEAFSDMMAAGIEAAWRPSGNGPAPGDWTFGEDVSTGAPFRSFSDPHALGAPDHYSLKRVTVLSDDDGGVHTNASIVDHMYYLAIMGGTNRVSQIAVQGVGWANRDQIDRVVYRAFTDLLPASATFAVARAATIQAARDLFGAGSRAETAIAQAWTAVGVS